jgi:hypothetical protein
MTVFSPNYDIFVTYLMNENYFSCLFKVHINITFAFNYMLLKKNANKGAKIDQAEHDAMKAK